MLSFLFRKSKKPGLEEYKELFADAGIGGIGYLSPEHFYQIDEQISGVFPTLEREEEILDNKLELKDSKLLSALYYKLDDSHKCYVFSDEIQLYGMFTGNTRSVMNKVLGIAKTTDHDLCIVDVGMKFLFTVYHDSDRGRFEIGVKVVR